MRVITERDRIKNVSSAWDAQYEKHRGDPAWADKFVIGDKLRALNLSRVGSGTIEKIIGNTSWTDISCNACETKVLKAVEFNTFNDDVFVLCFRCLAKANKAAKAGAP